MTTYGLTPGLMDRLRGDHARIAGVVREFMEQSDAAVSILDWQRLSELIEFLDYYADQVHHPLEDRLFDQLVDRGLTPIERHLVFKNLREHQEIRAMTEVLANQIQLAKKGGAITRDEFVETAAEYVNLQRRHMNFEDSRLFPLLEAQINDKDWGVLSGVLHEEEGLTRENHK